HLVPDLPQGAADRLQPLPHPECGGGGPLGGRRIIKKKSSTRCRRRRGSTTELRSPSRSPASAMASGSPSSGCPGPTVDLCRSVVVVPVSLDVEEEGLARRVSARGGGGHDQGVVSGREPEEHEPPVRHSFL